MPFNKVNENKRARPEGRNCILVYGYGNAHFDTIARAAVSVGIDEVMHINESHLGKRIRDILDNIDEATPFTHTIEDPVIVMAALSDAELHHFLNKFRDLGIQRPLFAAVTPTSKNWRFGDLALELGKERREIATQQSKEK